MVKQIRTFESYESKEELDRKVNAWVKENKIDVVSISTSSRSVFIRVYMATVIYNEKGN